MSVGALISRFLSPRCGQDSHRGVPCPLLIPAETIPHRQDPFSSVVMWGCNGGKERDD